MEIKVIKKADIETPPSEPLSAFQIDQARIQSKTALNILEFYGEAIHEPDFQMFLSSNLSELCVKFDSGNLKKI